jgi:hypothetical protein
MPRTLQLLLSAAVITLINKVGIAAGFLGWYYAGTQNQLLLQVPLALTVSVGGVLLWLVRFGRWHRLDLDRDGILVFLLVLPVGAVILVPVHYLFTGYLTSFGNIVGGWMFAFLANIPAFALASRMLRHRAEQET